MRDVKPWLVLLAAVCCLFALLAIVRWSVDRLPQSEPQTCPSVYQYAGV